ncbi:hypothetical protein [Halorarius halobius]|uniref:hypothetical protein n=1 Tax=Halorarius halobius TaxID=2962671 RepID=UPI0020CEA3BB|nr:hypothetical protein [Halorarius halobius]
MASKEDQPVDLDGFEEPEVDGSDSNGGSIELQPGEHVVGTITAFKPWAGDYGVIEIDGQGVWLNSTLRQQLVSALIEGQQVAYVKSEDEESFTNDDGEEQTYNPRSFRFPSGDS